MQSLDGFWQIADSKSPTEMPAEFTRTVPVPGLAHLAKPAFPDVDKFISRENLANRIRSKLSPPEWLTNYWQGKIEQDRNYFWYRKTFRAPARQASNPNTPGPQPISSTASPARTALAMALL